MERPKEFAGVDIEAANVFRFGIAIEPSVAITARRFTTTVAPDHHHIVHDKRTWPAEITGLVFGVAVQRDASGIAEGTIALARAEIQRIQIFAADHEHALDFPVGPVRSASGTLTGGFLHGGL